MSKSKPKLKPWDDDEVAIPDVFVIRETDTALLCDIDGSEHWIPKSQIRDTSEVQAEGDDGELVITRWFSDSEFDPKLSSDPEASRLDRIINDIKRYRFYQNYRAASDNIMVETYLRAERDIVAKLRQLAKTNNITQTTLEVILKHLDLK